MRIRAEERPSEAELTALAAGELSGFSEAERLAVALARELTLLAPERTHDQQPQIASADPLDRARETFPRRRWSSWWPASARGTLSRAGTGRWDSHRTCQNRRPACAPPCRTRGDRGAFLRCDFTRFRLAAARSSR
jgi:hypothetical protein